MRIPKVIAVDLDGTLLQNGAMTLNDNTCGLMHELHEKYGTLFVPTSGRQYSNLQILFEPIKDEIAYICENGCLTFVNGKLIHQEVMKREDGEELIRAIQERDGCDVLLSGIHTSYLCTEDQDYIELMSEGLRNSLTLLDDIFSTTEPYFKIAVYEKAGLSDTNYWKEWFGSRFNVVASGLCWLDFMPKHVSKESGLRALSEYLKIAPEDMMAFGDHENDREMMDFVGCPIAVDNAIEEIKAKSLFTTDLVEHSLERILSREGYDW
ncbi:MAG: HAD-IIB family hydrolase [Solobacterium sp.]|nr:HAD-IIB family hydrolase [Solobacterium sp.]